MVDGYKNSTLDAKTHLGVQGKRSLDAEN